MNLAKLSTPFFQMIANICQVNRGKNLVLVKGYLRRSLDKLMILYENIIKVKIPEWTPYSTSDILERHNLNKNIEDAVHRKNKEPDYTSHSKKATGESNKQISTSLREEIQAIFDVLIRNACHVYPKFGSANDLIMHSFYRTVEICKYFITNRVEYKRTDYLVTQSYCLMGAIAKDSYSIENFVETYGIYEMVDDEIQLLSSSSDMNEDGINALILLLEHISRGKGSRDSISKFKMMQVPLLKVSRLFPSFQEKCSSLSYLWTNNISLFDTKEKSSEEILFEEYVRSGKQTTIDVVKGSLLEGATVDKRQNIVISPKNVKKDNEGFQMYETHKRPNADDQPL